MSNRSDSRGGAPMSGLGGITKDARAKRAQTAMRGSAALVASLRPTEQAMRAARRRMALEPTRLEAVDAHRRFRDLCGDLPYEVQGAVMAEDVQIGVDVPGGFMVVEWDIDGPEPSWVEIDIRFRHQVQAAINARKAFERVSRAYDMVCLALEQTAAETSPNPTAPNA